MVSVKQQCQAQSDKCKIPSDGAVVGNFWGTPWSNKSDAHPPEGDNPRNLLFSQAQLTQAGSLKEVGRPGQRRRAHAGIRPVHPLWLVSVSVRKQRMKEKTEN